MPYTNDYGLATGVEDGLTGAWGYLINENYKRYEEAVGGSSVVTLSAPPGDSTYDSVTQVLIWVADFSANAGASGSEYRAKHIRFDPGTETISSSPVDVIPTNTVSGTDRNAQMVFIVENNTGTDLRLDPVGTFSTFALIPSGKSGIVGLTDEGGSPGNAEDILRDLSVGSITVPLIAPTDSAVDMSDAASSISTPLNQSSGLRITGDPFGSSDDLLVVNTSTNTVTVEPGISVSALGSVNCVDGLTVSTGDSNVEDLTVSGTLDLTGDLIADDTDYLPYAIAGSLKSGPDPFGTFQPNPNPPLATTISPPSSVVNPGSRNIPGTTTLNTFTINTGTRSGNSRVFLMSYHRSISDGTFALGSRMYIYKQVVIFDPLPFPGAVTYGDIELVSTATQSKPAFFLSDQFAIGPTITMSYIDNIPSTILPVGPGATSNTYFYMVYFSYWDLGELPDPPGFVNSYIAWNNWGYFAIDFGVAPS